MTQPSSCGLIPEDGKGDDTVSYRMPHQTEDTINARYAERRFLNDNPEYVARRDARLEADGEAYRHERRLRNIRRYLRERAAR